MMKGLSVPFRYLWQFNWIVVITVLALAVDAYSQTETNEGARSIQGVQMSIGMSTKIITTGSLTGIFAEIRNLSTNDIILGETGPATDFELLLKDSSGKEVCLTDTHPRMVHFSLRTKMKPGESRNWIIPVTIGKNIKSGEYTLRATRKFSMSGEFINLESNLLKVEVK